MDSRAPRPSVFPSLAYRGVALALGLVAAGLLFEQLIDIFLLVVLTAVIALPVARGATFLERFRVPRPVGAPLCLLSGLGVFGLVLAFVIPPFVHQLEGFVNQLPSTLTTVEHAINHAFGLKPGTVARTVERFVRRYTQHPQQLLGPLSSIGQTLFTAVAALVVVLISALYTAIKPEPVLSGLVRLFPPDHRAEVRGALGRIADAWLGWLRGITIDMLVLGGLLFAGMELVGLPFAVGFAVFSALMTVIPNYGSVISAIPPIIFGLTHSFHEGVLVAVVYVVVNQIEGNLVLPLIMGRATRLHPAAVAVAVLVAGSLFGALGLVLSVPLLSLAQILVQELWIKPQARRDAARPGGARDSPEAVARRAVYGAVWFGAALIVIGLLATQLMTLLLAVMFTVIISLPLAASASALARHRVPRHLGALLALAAGLGALGGLIAFLVPSMGAQVNKLVAATPGIVHSVEVRIGHITGQGTGHVAYQLQHYVTSWVRQPSHVVGPLATIGLGAATVVGGLVIGLITAYYIAVRPEPLTGALIALVPARRRDRASAVMSRLRTAWLGWLRGLVISMVIVGVLLYLGLALIVGLPFALSFAVFSAVAEVVPYLGALVSGVPPVAFALTVSPGTALAVLVIYIAVHQIEANIVAPVVMSRSVRLHPALIAIGVVAVGEVFGFLGLVLAVPILSMIVVVTEELWVKPLEARRWRRAASAGEGRATRASRASAS